MCLEPRDNNDVPAPNLVLQSFRFNLCDARSREIRVCADTRLESAQTDCIVTEISQSHGQQRPGDQFAGGQEQVHLARRGIVRDAAAQLDKLVRCLPHRGHNNDEVITRLTLFGHP